MYILIYKFTIKTQREKDFVESWRMVTEGIRKHRGSLGSRLHKDSAGKWIAYAQWPSKEVSERIIEMPDQHRHWFKKMTDSLEKMETLFEMDVVEDLLAD